ncbi:MAG: ribosome biogenesis GTPase Der [Candidatus Saelkia tenebricola]|nr:ribosome biogenesis GTPase Der [Candidatus Saelkia tenebricola]
MSDYPKVAIIGRPNVGKSTLFNRLIGERFAITEETYGVTRDRVYKDAQWCGVYFTVIDTGGIIVAGDLEDIAQKVKQQSLKAIQEADLVVFLTDCKDGVHPLDEDIADVIRRGNKKVILTVNKADNAKSELEASEFQSLGIRDIVAISAMHGRGVDLLLEKITENIENVEISDSSSGIIKVAVIGCPNAGKSSFVNSILEEERSVVDSLPGTTRDAVDTLFHLGDSRFMLIDTAGIRHKSKIKGGLNFFSSLRTKEAIDRADVVLFMVDGWCGVRRDDMHHIYKVWQKNKGLILVINKRDLIQKSIPEYEKLIRNRLALAEYVPIIYISAKKKYNIEEAMIASKSVYDNLNQHVRTSELNKFIQDIQFAHPKIVKGKHSLKIFYITQTGVVPPQMHAFVNFPGLVNKSFTNFLERRIRQRFGFMGAPIKLVFRAKNE